MLDPWSVTAIPRGSPLTETVPGPSPPSSTSYPSPSSPSPPCRVSSGADVRPRVGPVRRGRLNTGLSEDGSSTGKCRTRVWQGEERHNDPEVTVLCEAFADNSLTCVPKHLLENEGQRSFVRRGPSRTPMVVCRTQDRTDGKRKNLTQRRVQGLCSRRRTRVTGT